MKKLLIITLLFIIPFVWVSYEMKAVPSILKANLSSPSNLVINNINIITMAKEYREVLKNRTIFIENGIITFITENKDKLIADKLNKLNKKDFKIINGKGRYLMPGLIDAHVHVSDEAELAGYLAYGVTGLRNMSGYPFHLRLQKQIEKKELLAPDFITTGPTLNSLGPNSNPIQQIVTTKQEAINAVDQQYNSGFKLIKLYSNLTKEAFEGVLEEANRLNIKLTGHSPEGVRETGIPYQKPFNIPWEESIGKGFQTLEHTETLIWHGLRDRLDPNSIKGLANILTKSGDVLVPTLIAHRRLVNIAETKGKYLKHPEADTINPLVTLISKSAIDYWTHLDASKFERPHSNFYSKATGLLHIYGVPILVGTDSGGFGLIPGYSILEEMQLLLEAGISPFSILMGATSLSAKTLGFGLTGQVKVGYKANLILINKNPLEDLSTLNQIDGVIKQGVLLDKADLISLKIAAKDTSLTRSFIRILELLIYKL